MFWLDVRLVTTCLKTKLFGKLCKEVILSADGD